MQKIQKKKSCRFNFGKYFTSENIIVQPFKNANEFEQFSILVKRNNILSKVSKYINECLDPSKKCGNQVVLNMYLANYKSWTEIIIGHFQSQQILTIRFNLKEAPVPVLLVITIQCCLRHGKLIWICNQFTFITRQIHI